MGMHKVDDIAGVNCSVDGVKCLDCMEKTDWDVIKEEEIITRDQVEDDEIFFFFD